MKCKSLASVILIVLVAVSLPASAGTWGTQVVLATNAYNGTVALDASGNMTSVWFQANLPNGTAVNEIWAATAPFGQPWSAPVNISGTIGNGSSYPSVRTSTSGNATAVYTSPTLGGAFVDHPAGGNWGTPGTTNGVNQFYVSNDNGDEGVAWGTGGARPTSSTDGTMAVAWESFNSTCGSRTCTTSNWVLHVSTRAPGVQNWVDSGALLGPDAKQHFGQLAADAVGDIGVLSISAGNVVSLVHHSSGWTGAVVVASTSVLGSFNTTGRDNRAYASDSSGHATIVGWGNVQLTNLVAVDGNLATNTWGSVSVISGSDQYPGYFDFQMSSSGAAIAFYWVNPYDGTGNTIWRAATRPGTGKPWNAPATAGVSYDAGATPDGVAINSAGEAAVVFHGYSTDFLTYILYTNTYKP